MPYSLGLSNNPYLEPNLSYIVLSFTPSLPRNLFTLNFAIIRTFFHSAYMPYPFYSSSFNRPDCNR